MHPPGGGGGASGVFAHSHASTMGQTSSSKKEIDLDKLPEYTAEEVDQHKHKSDCWIVVNGLVLDVTEFLEDHPGGATVLLNNSGSKDATAAFARVDHSAYARDEMTRFIVGKLAGSQIKKAIKPKKAASTKSRSSKTKSSSSKPAAAAAAAPAPAP